MRAMRLGIAAAAMTCLLGTSTALACDVYGTVICERTSGTDPVIPLAGVGVTLTQEGTGPDGSAVEYLAGPTDANGSFYFWLYWGTYGLWSVDVDLDGAGPGLPIALSPVEIPWQEDDVFELTIQVPASLVPACTTQTLCDVTGVPVGPLACLDRPIGNPEAECKAFGNFVVVGEGFNVNADGSVTATQGAAFAIVKGGRACYAITKPVAEGTRLTLPLRGGASHVTYCGCP